MLFNDPGAEEVFHHGHDDSVLMIRETNNRLGKLVSIPGNHLQVQVLDSRRIGGGLLHDAQLRVDGHNRVVGASHIIKGSTACALEHRFSETCDMPPKRGILQVSGCDLEGRRVEISQKIITL